MLMDSKRLPDLVKLCQLSKKHPDVYEKILTYTDSCSVILKILEHQALFERLCRIKCERFASLGDFIHGIPPEAVVIYLADIGLYGVFTHATYFEFCTSTRDNMDDEGASVDLYQVVISERKQKLVFACTDPSQFLKLREYANKCFSKTVSVSNSEISVDIACNGDTDIATAYNKLYNLIRNHGDMDCCNAMKPIPVFRKDDVDYREYSCVNTLGAISLEELISALKTAQIPTIINNGTIIIGNNNNVNSKPDSRDTVAKWIKSNPPRENEATTDYHDRYAVESQTPCHINQFGPIVKSLTKLKVSKGTDGVRVYRK